MHSLDATLLGSSLPGSTDIGEKAAPPLQVWKGTLGPAATGPITDWQPMEAVGREAADQYPAPFARIVMTRGCPARGEPTTSDLSPEALRARPEMRFVPKNVLSQSMARRGSCWRLTGCWIERRRRRRAIAARAGQFT